MKKRLYFECWNCRRPYSLLRDITDQQKLIVVCPYCNAEGIVKLEPYRQEKKVILRGNVEAAQPIGDEYQFPDVIPTHKPE